MGCKPVFSGPPDFFLGGKGVGWEAGDAFS